MSISTFTKALVVAGIIIIFAPLSASALSLTWSWSFTGTENQNGTIDTASGTFTTTGGTGYDPSGETQYTVVDITGNYDGYTITGLQPTSSNNDNLIEWNGTNILADFSGVAFYTTDLQQTSVTIYNGRDSGFGTVDSYIIGSITHSTLQPIPFDGLNALLLLILPLIILGNKMKKMGTSSVDVAKKTNTSRISSVQMNG